MKMESSEFRVLPSRLCFWRGVWVALIFFRVKRWVVDSG